jgi:hypothetical protein
MAAAGLTATKIQLKTPRSGNNDDANEVEVKGAIVGALGGSCPSSRTFTVGTRNITTTATTQFRNVACADLNTGTVVEVKGTLVNGVVQASVVKAEEAENEAEVKGTIDTGSLAGACGSTLSFKVNGTLVKTTASTQFKDVQCSSLKAGDSVEVKGTRNTDGSITATRVQKD